MGMLLRKYHQCCISTNEIIRQCRGILIPLLQNTSIFREVLPVQVIQRVLFANFFFVESLQICTTLTEKSVMLTAKLVGLPFG
jgi:hypothetical protein